MRTLCICLTDWATTFAVGALGFFIFGERAALWLILAAMCSGTTARLLVERAFSRAADRRAFILHYLREHGEAAGLAMVNASGGLLRRGTCYVHLHRLEGEGVIWSRQDTAAPLENPKRRLYQLTGSGLVEAEKGMVS